MVIVSEIMFIDLKPLNWRLKTDKSFCEMFSYHFPIISCLKCTVNLKEFLANEWLRINRARPVNETVEKVLCLLLSDLDSVKIKWTGTLLFLSTVKHIQ